MKTLFKTKCTENNIRFPLPGQRILRSVLAVMICFIVYFFRNKNGIPFYSALAVLQCMQPYRDSTLEIAKKRSVGTFVGAFWGLMVILLYKNRFIPIGFNDMIYYIVVSIFTGIVIYSTVLLKIQNTSYFSCVVFLSIVVNHIGDQNPVIFVINRICDTLIGVIIALVINSIHLPRTMNKDTLFITGIDQALINPALGLTSFSKIELNRLIDSGAKFTVSTIRTPASVREAIPDIHMKIPIIAMDGAVLYDMKENIYIEKDELSYDQTACIMNILNKFDVNYFLNVIFGNSHVIYYQELKNFAEKEIYNILRVSPYRNYIQKELPKDENVVYIMLIEKTEKVQLIMEAFQNMSRFHEYRFHMYPSDDYPGYSYIKIYRAGVSRENMKLRLLHLLQMEKSISFGSEYGYCDVLIKNADHNEMVKALKQLYEPCIFFYANR